MLAGRQKNAIITFFFHNFPEGCSEERLRRKFEEAGKVLDLFIPTKRDKSGKRFGFVRYAIAGEEGSLLTKLNNIWIDSYVIRVSCPRFERPTESRGTREDFPRLGGEGIDGRKSG